jgi:Major Facilitator Superfamily
VNLPCDGVAFLILLLFLDIETPRTPLAEGLRAIDWTGTVLIIGGVVMFLIGLEVGGVTLPWDSAEVLCLMIFGIVVLGLFLITEWKFAKYPITPLRLFKRRSAVAAFATCFSHGMTFIAGSYFLPLYFQAIVGSDPLMSGVDQLGFVGGLSITSIGVGIFIRKTGRYREPIWFGMSLMTLGYGLFIDLPNTEYWGKIAPYLVIAGLGCGPNFQAPLIALQNHVDVKDMATATAMFAFVRNLASSIGLVIGGVIFENRMQAQLGTLLSVLPPAEANFIASGSAGASVPLIAKLPGPVRDVVRNVFNKSLSEMWIFFTATAGIGFAASLLLQKKELSRQHQVRKQGLEQQKADRQEELDKREKKKELGAV